jgi:hypothetical protein
MMVNYPVRLGKELRTHKTAQRRHWEGRLITLIITAQAFIMIFLCADVLFYCLSPCQRLEL